MNDKRAVLFVNGELPDVAAAAAMINDGDDLIAVDGGLRHMQAMGLTPHLLIGDLDSVSQEDVAAMQSRGVTIKRFPPEKDETDIELALEEVLQAGYHHIVLVAALGGRLDHTLGSLSLLTNPAFREVDVRMDDGCVEAFVIWQAGAVHGKEGDMVSLLPVDAKACGVRTENLAYPLRGETLLRHAGRGISNVMLTDQAKITVEEGVLFCLHTRQ